jgi:FkbM family methyltransferase
MIERLAKFLQSRGVDFGTFCTVFDIGSRDGLQSLELANLFPQAEVVAVECNPATLEQCRLNASLNPRVKLVDKAVNSYTGRCPFFPTDPSRTITSWADGNPGASSLFIATGDYPAEKYVQNEVEIDCIRLDHLCEELKIDAVDLIWMDLQGAELLALQSAGALLDKARYIYTEVSHRPLYKGQCLFDDVDAFLTARGFRRCTKINRERWQQDIIYENARDLIDVVIPFDSGDLNNLELSARSIRKFVKDVRHIYAVSAADPNVRGVRFVDEKAFPFDIGSIGRSLNSHEQLGRYMQQLIKLYFPLVQHSCLEHVLAVDAGAIFLGDCQFIADGRPVFDFDIRPYAPYFEHMARLYPKLRRMFAYSGVAHCLPVKRSWLEHLRGEVEALHRPLPFWKAYLEAVDPAHLQRGASECEIYFNFCLMFHPDDMVIRRLHWAEDPEDMRLNSPQRGGLHGYCGLRQVDRANLEKFVTG